MIMINNNINRIMLHKTVDDTDAQSVSTKVASTKAASFLTTAKRQMYRNKTAQDSKKVQMQICNMIALQPQFSSLIIKDHVHFLQSGQNYVSLTDFHYNIANDRAKPLMIPRNCQPSSQLLFSSAKKPGATTHLQSVHKFSNNEYPLMLHINITKYNQSENSIESRDIYIQFDSHLQAKHFVTIQNSKKAILVSTSMDDSAEQCNLYQIWFMNIIKGNKVKNPNHSSMIKSKSLSFREQASQYSSKTEKQYIFNTIQCVKQPIKMAKGQKIIKVINSEFGDSILVCTNKDVYEMQFEPNLVSLKKLDIITKLAKYLKQDNYQDELKDICYIIDGLKVNFVTQKGLLGLIEAQNIQYAKPINQVLSNAHKKQQFSAKFVHSLVEKVAIQTHKSSVLIFKYAQNQIVFQKKIQLPVLANQTISYRVTALARHDQLILQRVSKQGKLCLQILTKNLLSPGKQFSLIHNFTLTEKSFTLGNLGCQIKVINSKSNSISTILRQNTVYFYRLNQNYSTQSNPVQFLFSKSFFEKPLYISIDPYSSNIIILFKQFVKFYKFCYKDIVQFYTYNVRNVCYAGYSQSGQYIMIAADDLLYFINSFTFKTENVIQAYGDIKSVRFFDNILYLLLKNKVNKNSSYALTMQTYIWQNNQYKQFQQLKIQPTEAVLTSSKFSIVASSKQIAVYRPKPLFYDQPETSPFLKQKNAMTSSAVMTKNQIQLLHKKSIKLIQANQYPTCVTLCEEFGILLIGTSCGRIYEYMWPFQQQKDIQAHYTIACSTSDIVKIHMGTSFEKIYVFCRNMSILQLDIIQYVQGQEMPNIYVINSKTLYQGQQLKYQFANRQYLYQNYTSYIFEDIRQSNQAIQQLRFILQKTKDDIQQHITKETQKYQEQIASINDQKAKDVGLVKKQITDATISNNGSVQDIKEKLKLNQDSYIEQKAKQKDEYEKKLLQLYAQSSRLRGIIGQLNKQHTKQKDLYLIQNQKIIDKLKQEAEKVQQEYISKFKLIQQNSSCFQYIQKQEANKKIEQQLNDYKQAIRTSVNQELSLEEQKKQQLLGSNGYLTKQIINYKQRKDEFEALVMETNLQIQELHQDEGQYLDKKKYLINELAKKEKIIEEKERELVQLIQNAGMMAKLKQTHEFELKQYQKQFQPILSKIGIIQRDIQKMNGQILKQYLNKVETQKSIIQNKQKFDKLKKQKIQRIKSKLGTQTRLNRFLAQLQFVLQDPLNSKIKDQLSILSVGEKLIINQQQIRHRVNNAKLMRKKQFIGKQIEQQEKREQQLFKNTNQINRHYNQNTMLVREFNNLKQLNNKLQTMVKQAELKLIAAKSSNQQTPRKKTNSMIELKKFSQKKLTPFQRHEQEFTEMFKGQTTQTKLTRSGGQSLSLLKTLIKDVEGTDSRYEKMEIVRNRIKSFVNPEIRIRKTLATQRMLFQHKKTQSNM